MKYLKSKLTAVAISIVVGTIFFLILPVSSQAWLDTNSCDIIAIDNSCTMQDITYSQQPLLVVLTNNNELVAMKATNEIYRNLVISLLLAGGYLYLTFHEQASKKGKKTKSKKLK